MNRISRRILAVVPLVLAGLATLSGCHPAQLGAAAIVDGHRIPVDELQGTVTDVRSLQERIGHPAQSTAELARGELQRRLIMTVYERAARELGVTVTPGEVSAELAKARQAAGSEEEFASQIASQNLSMETVKEYVRQILLGRKIGERLAPGTASGQPARDQAVTQRLVQTAKRMRFEVNPRYGDFNTDNGQLVAHQDDFLRQVTIPSSGAGAGTSP